MLAGRFPRIGDVRRIIRRFWRRAWRALGLGRTDGIRFRLAAALAIVLLPFLLLAAVRAQIDFREQAETRRHHLDTVARDAAFAVQARLQSATILLHALDMSPDGEDCGQGLALAADWLDDAAVLVRLDADGAPECASTPEGVEPWMAALGRGELAARLRDGAFQATGPAPDGARDEQAVAIGLRVSRPDGAWTGAHVAVLPLSALIWKQGDGGLPNHAEAALLGADGRVLAATDSRLFPPGPAPEWIDQARRDGAAVIEAGSPDGERRIQAAAPVAGRDLFVVFSTPSPGLWSWARLNPISVFLLPLGVWLTVFLVGMVVADRLVLRWLLYLGRIAALFARGRFSIRPVQAVNAPVEIRVLARTLDDMADGIVARDRSLTDSLDQKDALMREIHHRVKNNLQVISSLVSLQQRALKDEAARAALGETRQRIAALALIHRVIYQGGDVRGADARDFLTELVGQLMAAEAAFGPPVSARVESDRLIVDPDKLTPLALWLVEAVSNAQKHAFSGRGGVLTVRFRVDGDTSVLEVEDDGPGLAPRARAGAGRTLMNAFARQLRGQTRIVARAGGGVLARLTLATPRI